MRGDAGELRLHALEERPLGLGAQVLEAQAERGAGLRVHELRHRASRREHVLARLAEELERERDVRLVDVLHVRNRGDVRRAVRGAGGDRTWHGAVEAVAQLGQGERKAHSGEPARGPGV